MILQECSPVLRRRATVANHVFGNSGFRDIDAQFQNLAVYSRCAPKWICQGHFPNQLPGFPANTRTPAFPAFPSPVVAKTLTMPADHCRWLHDVQNIRPAYPAPAQHHPKQTVRIRQLWSGTTTFQCCQLLPQSQILKRQRTLVANARSKHSKDNFEPLPHNISPA